MSLALVLVLLIAYGITRFHTLTVAQTVVSYQCIHKVLWINGCRCGEMADAQDLKSWDRKKSCGFESHHRHQPRAACCQSLAAYEKPREPGNDWQQASGGGSQVMEGLQSGNSPAL